MNTKEINKAFEALHWAFDSCTINHADALLNLCKAEERGHRGFMSDFDKYHPNAPSVSDMARLFAVKRVAEYLNGSKMPKGKDFLHFQHSAFYAAGMADEYATEIRAVWKDFDLSALATLNYTEFVKVTDPVNTEALSV